MVNKFHGFSVLVTLLAMSNASVRSEANTLDLSTFGVSKLQVKEGFPEKSLQGATLNAWNSTLFIEAVYTTSEGPMWYHGSAAIVAKYTEGSKTYLGILTAKHVLSEQPTAEFKFFKNVSYVSNGVEHKELKVTPLPGAKILTKNLAPQMDLALMVVEVPSFSAELITPIPLARSCNLKPGAPVFLIGFPDVQNRPSAFQNVPIAGSDQVKKRWSVGVYVGSPDGTEFGPLVGTTADAIYGNSGGPALNAQGELIGVLSAVAEGGTSYYGDERPEYIFAHSGIVECNATTAFVTSTWHQFLKTLGTSKNI